MRRLAVLLLVAGLGVVTLLVLRQGIGAVWHALTAIGWWGFALICLSHLVLIGLMGWAWQILLPRDQGLPLRFFFWARLVRDSGAEILPLSQLGGFAMGARAATLFGMSGTLAAASTVVDVTMEMFAQLAFTALGLCLLAQARPEAPLVMPSGVAVLAMLAAAITFVAVQRRGLSLLERITGHLLGDWAKTGLSLGIVEQEIRAIYARPARAILCTAVHLVCWLGTALETWLALWLMGFPIHVTAVLAIESLLYAARSVAFAVPNALGLQEGAYILLGGLFGLAPETVLALSLLKRGRDLTIGAPALLFWQSIEARRALSAKGAAARDPSPRRLDAASLIDRR